MNLRLERERANAAERRVKASEKAQLAAQKRWAPDATSNARGNAPSIDSGARASMPEAMLEQCPPHAQPQAHAEAQSPSPPSPLEGDRGNFYGSRSPGSEVEPRAEGTSEEQWQEQYRRIREVTRDSPPGTSAAEIARVAGVSVAKVKAAAEIYKRKRKGAKIPDHVLEDFTSVH
jgi:hypothetical protein